MPSIMRNARDALTGLQDREGFYARASKMVAKRGPSLSIAYLRLLNVGSYNVRKGVAAGDEMVRYVAARLCEHIPKQQLGRFSSGNFMALAPTDDLARILEEVNRDLIAHIDVDGIVLKAGYCELDGTLTLYDAMERARFAFEDIRMSSPSYSRLFDKGLETAFERRAYVIEHLDEAIERGEIRAYAQPIVRVLTGLICEVEILARWESEQYGFLRPDEFVPELERHQLIHRLDAEVIRRACSQWREAADVGINVPFGINLSRLDFELCDIFAVVTEIMERYNVPVEQVHIEVTESALSHSNDVLIEGIERFREAGFELYLDDFGSGYSSLSVLEGTLFDVVKLDMSLLQEVEHNERARVIVADAVSMVKRLALQTLCEGVESEDQFLFLKAVGCEKAQGYFFGKPQSHEEIMEHLLQTVDQHERLEDTRYYDAVGKVNLMDGTRSSVQGVEAAHFLATQPFALIEILGKHVDILSANTAFMRMIRNLDANGVRGITERLSTDLSDIRNKVVYTASKALRTRSPQQFDLVIDGRFCTLGITHVESSQGREAFLLQVLGVTRYSQFNNFKLLEQSLSFLYTIFKRIDLLDMTDNTWTNIYLNVPRYSAIRVGATPQDEIDAFCDTFIHPDDRDRFRDFYDLSTIEERMRAASSNHVTDTFCALLDNDRYEDHIFMIIPMVVDGHRQFLSCMRDLDLNLGASAQSALSGDIRISDEVLLSGILDVTDRNIFWKDDKRRLLGANQNFLDYYGFAGIEEVMGKTDEELGWAQRNKLFADDERRVLRGDSIRGVLGVTTRADGAWRRIETSKMPLVKDGRIVGLVGFFRDIGPLEESAAHE